MAGNRSDLFSHREREAAWQHPLEGQILDDNLNFLRWQSGADGPVDAGSAPGMAPHLDLFNQATDAREEDRAGTGMVGMGARGANPTFMGLLKEQMANRRRERAGGQLYNALNARRAEVLGTSFPALSLGQNRRMGLAQLAGNQALGYAGARAGFQPGPSLFASLLDQAQRAAQTAAQFGA